MIFSGEDWLIELLRSEFRIQSAWKIALARPIVDGLDIRHFTIVTIPGIDREALVAIDFTDSRGPVSDKPDDAALLEIDTVPFQQFEFL